MKCSMCKMSYDTPSMFVSEKEYSGVDFKYTFRLSPICKECFQAYVGLCRKCKRHIIYDSFEQKQKSDGFCKECRNEMPVCSKCGIIMEHWQKTIVHNNLLCPNCEKKRRNNLFKDIYDKEIEEDVIVYVYINKKPCPSHKELVECVTAYVKAANDLKRHPINVFYCIKCNKYYINLSEYISFAKKYGLPFFRAREYMFKGKTIDFSEWSDQSILNYMGYNVNSEENLSYIKRREILRDCISLGIRTKPEVLSFLNSMISLHEGEYKFIEACKKWQDDYDYIYDYNLDSQRSIYAKFVLR